jgi:hypothetical protein
MRVMALRLNCAPVRSLKTSTEWRGWAVTMRCTSLAILVTASALQWLKSMSRI